MAEDYLASFTTSDFVICNTENYSLSMLPIEITWKSKVPYPSDTTGFYKGIFFRIDFGGFNPNTTDCRFVFVGLHDVDQTNSVKIINGANSQQAIVTVGVDVIYCYKAKIYVNKIELYFGETIPIEPTVTMNAPVGGWDVKGNYLYLGIYEVSNAYGNFTAFTFDDLKIIKIIE